MVIWETERLLLKEIEMKEAEMAAELLSLFNSSFEGRDEKKPSLRKAFDREQVEAYIKVAYGFYGYGYYGVYEKATAANEPGKGEKLIGVAGFREGSSPLEVGYAILSEYRGHGLASEALYALTEFAKAEFQWVLEEQDSIDGKDWAFEKLHDKARDEKIYAFYVKNKPLCYGKVKRDNKASIRVLRKNGFKEVQ